MARRLPFSLRQEHSNGYYGLGNMGSTHGLFDRIGCTIEMGNKWGTNDTTALNSKSDSAYSAGGIYHLMCHPSVVNWEKEGYADHISNRTDVWYVPFGSLYLYHWVDARNIVNVTSTGSELDKVFKLSIGATDHLNYGVSYPITYVFDIPSNWTSGYVYYRYLETGPWVLMENKSAEDFFNGVDACRFNFTGHKTYVSVRFSDVSHEIHLQLRNTTMPPSSPPVGGIWIPVDKLQLLAPWIASASTIISVMITADVFFRLRRKAMSMFRFEILLIRLDCH